MNIYLVSGVVVLLSAIYLQFYGLFGSSAIPVIKIVLAAVGGIGCGLLLVLRHSKLRKPHVPETPKNVEEMSKFLRKMYATQFHKPYNQPTMVTKTIDKEIQEIFDLFIRDFCLSWFQNLGKDENAFKEVLTKELWEITKNFVSKLQQVDVVKFLSNDFVSLLCSHFQELRLSDQRRYPGTAKPFILHSCLSNADSELEYLRTAIEAVSYALLSPENCNSAPLRYLLREILAYTVVQPMFEMICDPDYINQTLLLYLESKEKLSETHKKDYAYAETYEEFIRLINTSQDIEAVKQLRYHIIAEIMQATSINNIKGLEHHGKQGQSNDKGEMLRSRNLKRYINQCTVAKAQCEKRIKMLGGPDYTNQGGENVTDDGGSSRGKTNTKRQKVLTYSEIIDNSLARSYFMQFLGHDGARNMLRFWLAVENMKQLKKVKPSKLQESAREVYNLYVIPSAKHAIHADTTFVRKMETYLSDGQNDDGFFEAQKQIYHKMEEKFYRKFVISEEYVQYICQLESALDHFRSQKGDEGEDQLLLDWSDGTEGFEQQMKSDNNGKNSYSLEERNDHIIKQLSILDQKLASKTQQIELVKKLHDMHIQGKQLEKEIESLKKQKCDLEAHMERAELWCDNVGKWKVVIQSASVEIMDDKPQPVYILMVHRSSASGESELSSDTQGWMVARTLKDFHTLHSKLKECCNYLKKELQLPSKKWFKNFDDEFLKNSKEVLENYLQMLLEDETISLNEELYQFVCPSLEKLKEITTPVEKKSVFSLKSVLKSFPLIDFNFTEDLDEEQSEEDGPGDRKDSIAEPLYSLTGEVFELKGVFKWLRRTLIAFVQVTFGRTINREIRELVQWTVSEPMIVYYIQTFCDVMWPHGKLAPPSPKRSDTEKLKTRRKVKEKLLEMSPEVLQNLVGKRNCKLGIIKMFEAFQDIRTNKHLAYLLFELCVFTLFPEIRLNEASSAVGNMESTSKVGRQSDEETKL